MIPSVWAGARGFALVVSLLVTLLLVVQGPTLRTTRLDGLSGLFNSDAGPLRLQPALLQIHNPCWLHCAWAAFSYPTRAFQRQVSWCWQAWVLELELCSWTLNLVLLQTLFCPGPEPVWTAGCLWKQADSTYLPAPSGIFTPGRHEGERKSDLSCQGDEGRPQHSTALDLGACSSSGSKAHLLWTLDGFFR